MKLGWDQILEHLKCQEKGLGIYLVGNKVTESFQAKSAMVLWVQRDY